jgi:nucleotide-binding universal stress UspA family protein
MEKPIKSIIAATNLGTHGNDAVKRAALLAHAHGLGSIRALHVIDKGWRSANRGTDEDAHHRLVDLAARIRHEEGLTVLPRTRKGRTLDVIAAESAHCDLLVMGASSGRGIRDLLLGSTAERLLATTKSSILAVRKPPRGAYRRVLVALDFSSFDETVLAAARAVAPGARFHLMHVFDTTFEGKMRYAGVGPETIQDYRSMSRELAMREMVAATDHLPERPPAVLIPGPIASNVVSQARSSNADLIVVGHPKRSWLSSLLVPRIAARVLAGARSDVLAVHGTAAE